MGYVCRRSTHSPVYIRQKAKKESGLYGVTDENALLEEDGPRRCVAVRVERGDQEPLGRRFGGIALVRYDRRGCWNSWKHDLISGPKGEPVTPSATSLRIKLSTSDFTNKMQIITKDEISRSW